VGGSPTAVCVLDEAPEWRQAARGSDNLFMRMCGVSRLDQLSFWHMLQWHCAGQRTRMEGRIRRNRRREEWGAGFIRRWLVASNRFRYSRSGGSFGEAVCKTGSLVLLYMESVFIYSNSNGFQQRKELTVLCLRKFNAFTFRRSKLLCQATIQVRIIVFRPICTWRWWIDLFCAICHKSVVLFPLASFVDNNWLVIGKPQLLFCGQRIGNCLSAVVKK
jgi:hypothetical protein